MRRDLRILGIAVVYVLAYLMILPWWTFSSDLMSGNSDTAFALGVGSTLAAVLYGLIITRSLLRRVLTIITPNSL